MRKIKFPNRYKLSAGVIVTPPPGIAALKGTVMTCCICRRDLYRLNRNVYWHETISADQFEPIEGPPPFNGMPGDCPFCGHHALGCFVSDILSHRYDPANIAYNLLVKGDEVDVVTGKTEV